MTTLADFLPLIPDQYGDGFAMELTSVAQFALNGSQASEPRPARGENYRHQNLAGYYFLLYSEGLIVHDLGTGKSRLATMVTETLQEYFFRKDEMFYSPPIKRFFVIARGDILTENWKQELVCSTARYFKDDWRDLAPSQQTKKVNQVLKDYYTFFTHNDLVNLVSSMTDEELIEYFSNTGIIVDEAHNLIVESSDSGTRIDVEETKKVYEILWKIFHLVPGMKKILMTATPMRNGPQELAKLLNLLNDEDHQIEDDIEKYTDEQLWEIMKGKVSYLREMTRKINVNYIGKPLKDVLDEPDLDVDTIVYPCPMIGLQEEVYIETSQAERKKGVYINTRQASNMVFPDGTFGSQGFKANIDRKKVSESKGSYNYVMKQDFADYFDEGDPDIEEQLDRLRELSSKNYETLKLAYENPTEKGINYNEYKQGSGAIAKLLLFEHILGYEIVTNKFLSQFAEDNGFCSGTVINFGSIPKRDRIALLVPEMSKANRKALINLYNAPENATGDYIRWCIYTPIGREGLSFNNVTRIIRDETWTDATGMQAEGRGLRANSQADLAEILGGEENVNVEVYRLLPTLTSEPNLLPTREIDQEEKYKNITTEKKKQEEEDEEGADEIVEDEIEIEDDVEDLEELVAEQTSSRISSRDGPEIYNSPAYAYYRSAMRGKRIDRMKKIIKKFDVTGYLHRKRNMQKDSLYDRYQLYNPPGQKFVAPKELDFAWYRRYPPENVINKIVNQLTAIFRTDFSIPISRIYSAIDEPVELIYICLLEIVLRQIYFNNRFGNKCFVAVSNSLIALVPQTTSTVIESEYYSTFSFRYKPRTLTVAMENYYLDQKKYELDRYFNIVTIKIGAILPTLPIVARNYLLEKAISFLNSGKKLNRVTYDVSKDIMEHYISRIYTEDAGTEKKLPITEHLTTEENPTTTQNGSLLISTLLSFKQSERVKHTDTSPLRNVDTIRIYDFSTKTWRNPTATELSYYAERIKNDIKANAMNLPNKQYRIYGYKLVDDRSDRLRIADPETFELDDARSHRTGRAFKQSTNDFKAYVYYTLNIAIPNTPRQIPTEEKKIRLLNAGIEFADTDTEQIDYKYRWLLWKTGGDAGDDTLPVEKRLKELKRLVIY